MELLNVEDRIFTKYRGYVDGNGGCTLEECRKKLTRNFILGTDKLKMKNDSVIRRRYGNLHITVDMDTFSVVDIYNYKGERQKAYINLAEKEMLNKILEINN